MMQNVCWQVFSVTVQYIWCLSITWLADKCAIVWCERDVLCCDFSYEKQICTICIVIVIYHYSLCFVVNLYSAIDYNRPVLQFHVTDKTVLFNIDYCSVKTRQKNCFLLSLKAVRLIPPKELMVRSENDYYVTSLLIGRIKGSWCKCC